jgi:RNA polymerase sigma factor (sigma-70 family)
MSRTATNPTLRLIRRMVEDQRVRGLPDPELLGRFHAEHDQAAFDALVQRHGAMVLDVCRSVLANEADAEDAFQTTFLVLARKAGSIRKAASLGSWLHGVAHRTALKLRAQSASRKKREARVPEREAPRPDEVSWRDVRQVLHEELSGLGERFRGPLILCYLQGKTQDAAAVQLGLAKGTLKGRLERGRTLLRARLVRRGLGPAALLVTTAWPAAQASASVPASLWGSTATAALQIAAGHAATAVVSARVAALTEGALRTMFLTKLKKLGTLVLVLGLLSGAAGLLIPHTEAQDPGPQDQRAATAQQPALPAPAKPAVIDQEGEVRVLAWSPNSKTLATIGIIYEVVEFANSDGGAVWPNSTIRLWDAQSGRLKQSLGEEKHTYLAAIAFSPDGKTAAVSASRHHEDPAKYQVEVRVMDVQTWSLKHKVDVAGFATVLAFSPDGKTLALGGGKPLAVKLWDVQKRKIIGAAVDTGKHVTCLAFSHDGKLLAAGAEDGKVRLFDGMTARLTRILEGHGRVSGVSFAQDGGNLVSGAWDKSLQLWDVKSGKLLHTLEANAAAPLTAMALSHDGRLLATGHEDEGKSAQVLLWDTSSGQMKKALPGQRLRANALAFSPDGSMLAIGANNVVRLGGDTPTGRINTPAELQLWTLTGLSGSPPKPAPKKENARTAALRKSLVELKKSYVLADEEILKCIQPPFSEARQACFRAYTNSADRQNLDGFMYFHWDKNDLKVGGAQIGSPASGYELPGLITAVAGIYPQEIEADGELLDNRVAADFIVRKGSPVAKIVTRLQTILQKECDLPLKLDMHEVERKVFVARGKYKFAPAAGADGKQVEIFAKNLTDPQFGGGGSGDLKKFTDWVGRFINRRVVLDKVDNAPRVLSWHDNLRSPFTKEESDEDRDPEAVLKNIEAQTGLSFREEARRVRVLRVERAK